jgi:hypothetical protein
MSYLKSIKKRFSFDVDKLTINLLKNLSKDLNTKNHGSNNLLGLNCLWAQA